MRDLNPQQYRIHLSAHDFESAGNFIQEARRFKPSDLAYEALLESAVTRYARPFSANERGQAKADARLDFDVSTVLADPDDVDLHDHIIRIRNKMVAHAESQFFPSQILNPTAPGGTGYSVVSTRWNIIQESLNLDAFGRIAAAMRLACLNRMGEYIHKL